MSKKDDIEVWKPVLGGNWPYEVSSHGRVRRSRYGKGTWENRILSQSNHSGGYLQVTLSNGTARMFLVHRLVVESFIGEIPHGMEVNHKDCNKKNNHVSNLEIVTPKENQAHMIANGLRGPIKRNPLFGEAHQNSTLTEKKVREIRKLYSTGKYCQREIGEMFGVTQTCVGKIVRRKAWPHV